MRTRLRERYGYLAHQLPYRTVRATLAENVSALSDFVREVAPTHRDGVCHFVGHGLGGLVMLKYLANRDSDQPGHAVCLGTPLNATAAERMADMPGVNTELGASIADGILAESTKRWATKLDSQKVGVIAGTHSRPLGRGSAPLPQPNDGMIAVDETRAAFVDDHLEIAASHLRLVSSREVLDQVAHFFAHGEFRVGVR